MSFPAQRPLIVAVAVTFVGAYQLMRTPQDTETQRLAAMSAQPASSTGSLQDLSTPLRFAPPAAGPASVSTSGNPAYDACIDQPSYDGAVIECQLLLQRPVDARRP